MPRFPISQNQIKNNLAIISGPDYRHIVKVLRLKPGNDITLFEDTGIEHIGIIKDIGTKEIKIEIAESTRVETESGLNITLLQGIPKGDKMDFIVEKTTELGVRTIVPVISERSQVRKTKRIERWRRIALESSESEVNAAKEKGFIPIRLGPRILRTETAGIVAVAVLQFLFGDI